MKEFNRLQVYDPEQRKLWLACDRQYVALGSTKVAPRPFNTRLSEKLIKGEKKSCDGTEMLKGLKEVLESYICYSDPRHCLLHALWIIGTYCYSLFSYFGYLFFHSSKMRSGKTTALELSSRLAYEASPVLNAPTAASIRDTAAEGGTVILDTLERLEEKSREAFSAIMELLDAGFRQGGTVMKMVPTKKEQYVRKLFPVYAPYILAAISKHSLSETAQDRAFPIEMQRKPLQVKKVRLELFGCEQLCSPLRDLMYLWVLENTAEIAKISQGPKLEASIEQLMLNDRAVDIWKPLFTVLQVLGFTEESQEWEQLASLAQEMHRNPEIARAKQQLRVLAGLRSISTNGRVIGMTSDLLRELKTKHIDLLEPELRELLKEWGFVQKSVRLNGEPRRAWEIPVEQLEAIKKTIAANVFPVVDVVTD